MSENIHGTVVALRLCGAWKGVLIRGASGAGKSDLALRLMAQGAQLVTDDRANVWESSGRVFASAPSPIAGLIEVRGLGISNVPYRPIVELCLVIDLVDTPLERMPEPASVAISTVSLARLFVDPRPASAPTLVIRAVESL